MFADGSYAIGGEQDVFAPHLVWIASLAADDSLRWSASYQSRPYVDGNGEQAKLTSLAVLDNQGLLVSGYIGAPDEDAFVLRVDNGSMPIWVKTYRSALDDQLSKVLPLRDGFIAFGNTAFTEETASFRDLWVVRASVDGRVPFSPDSGYSTENTEVQWQMVFDHGVHALAPVIAATSTLQGTPPAVFTVDAAATVGEMLTD
jgi:hypothetical protein